MRKPIFALISLYFLLLGCAVGALADTAGPITEATVFNPNPEDRLNLRAKPDKSSESLGKYYSGTKVQVLDLIDAKWARVRIGYTDCGYAEGYMMLEYLVFPESSEAVESALPLMRCLTDGGYLLHKGPSNYAGHLVYSTHEYKVGFEAQDIITVLGDLPNGWCHVSVMGNDSGNTRADDGGNVVFTGFIRQEQLTSLRESGGIITKAVVEYDPAPTHPFSQAELDAAAEIILKRFELHYIRCVMDRLWYDETLSDDILTNESKMEVSPEWIVFLSDFHTLSGSEVSGFEPEGPVKGWMWFLRRADVDSPWELVDWGLY